MSDSCEHLDPFTDAARPEVKPSSAGCLECLAAGGEWVHLRLCLTCGHVGCCDSSPQKHARQHAHNAAHPVIKSFEPGEAWAYCFADDMMLEAVPAYANETPRRHLEPPRQRPRSR